MSPKNSLILIKTLHTAVWFVMATASFYILYAGITKTSSKFLWACITLLVLETVTLLVNKWTCPLTPMAMRYTEERQDNFDIYLPLWLAKYNKIIFGTIFVIGLALVIANLF